MQARRVGRLLGGAAIAVLLAGCFKVDMNLEVAANNTISGTAVIAVDENLLELTGQNVDQLFADMDLSDLPPGSTTEAYQEDGFVGQEITFAEMPLDEFAGNDALSGSGTGEELNIVREGNEFRVSGGFDMSGQEFTGTDIPQQFMDSFEFRISITFPGEVKSATGDIDGNTVTWEPTFGENTRVEAVASAIPSSSSPLLMIVLIAVAVLVLGAVVYFVTHRKTPAAATDPGSMGFGDTPPGPAPPSMTAEEPVPTQQVESQPAADETEPSVPPAEGDVPPPPPPPRSAP
jgi:hypothetical protein